MKLSIKYDARRRAVPYRPGLRNGYSTNTFCARYWKTCFYHEKMYEKNEHIGFTHFVKLSLFFFFM